MSQGDEPNAKDDTRYYGVDNGAGLADLALDLSHRAENLTVGTNALSNGTTARWDVSHPRCVEAVLVGRTSTVGYIYTYGAGVTETRLEIVANDVVEARVNGSIVASVTIPGLSNMNETFLISWATEANPLPTGSAVRTELRAWNITDQTFDVDVSTHAASTSVASTAIWLASTTLGANAWGGSATALRFSFGRMHPFTEAKEDFDTLTAAPTLELETRREIPVPTKVSSAGDEDSFTGPVYMGAAAGLHQNDIRQASAIWSDQFLDVPDLDETFTTTRVLLDPAGSGSSFLGQYTVWRPIPRTVNQLRGRVHVQAWRTDANPADDVVARIYTATRPLTEFVNVPSPVYLFNFAEITVNANDGSGATGGAWYEFDLVGPALDEAHGTWLMLAFAVQDAGGAGPTSAQRWRVRAVTVEAGVDDTAGQPPIGGGA